MEGEPKYTYLNYHELEERVDRMIAEHDLAAFALMHAIADKAKLVVQSEHGITDSEIRDLPRDSGRL